MSEIPEMERYIGIPSMRNPVSGTNDSTADHSAYNLAHCYANGFGVEKDIVRALESLDEMFNLPFMGKLRKRMHPALSGDKDEDLGLFARSIVQYQKIVGQQLIYTSVRVAQNAASLQPEELREYLRAYPTARPTQVQVVFRNQIFMHSLLHYAALTNDIPLARDLLSWGYPVNTLDREDRTALFEACSLGNVEMVLFLLENNASPVMREETGLSPLHLLIFFDPTVVHHVCAQLLSKGADIMVETRRSHAWALPWHGVSLAGTPLHFAVGCRNTAVIRTLLDFGAEPNQRSGLLSPLDLAASFNLPEICTLLIENGATTSKHWYAGRSPLHFVGVSLFCSPIGKVRGRLTSPAISSII
jgi:hypothetical protein